MLRVREQTFTANLARYVAEALKAPLAVTSAAADTWPTPKHDPVEFIVIAMSRLSIDESHKVVELGMEELLWSLRCGYIAGRCADDREIVRVRVPRMAAVAFVSESAFERFASKQT